MSESASWTPLNILRHLLSRPIQMPPLMVCNFQKVFQQMIRIPVIRKRLPSQGRPRGLGKLYGILGNLHTAKDPVAAPHYNSNKGRYFF